MVSGTPEVIKAAFTKETDFFGDRGIEYISDAVSIEEPNYLKRNMFDIWGERFGITQDESDFAVEQGMKALEVVNADIQDLATDTEGKILVVGQRDDDVWVAKYRP